MRVTDVGVLADDPAVERLIALGRRKGRLTFDDIRDNLPIATMSEAAIAQAIARLEQAEIAIDLDPEIADSPPHGSAASLPAELPVVPDAAAEMVSSKDEDAAQSIVLMERPNLAAAAPARWTSGWRAFATLAVIAALLLAGMLLTLP